MNRQGLLVATSAIALLFTSAAQAQDMAVPASGEAHPGGTTKAPAPDDTGDLIVTAQGRIQRAQDVPIAVSVIDTSLIADAGVVEIRDLRQLTPSFQAVTGQSAATGAVIAIRGIGTAGDNPGFEPAVGIFIDGVFRARVGLALAELPELERVEILRGPQGTLFGRNTSAGALNITTARPKFEAGGYAQLSYGNYDEVELKGGINLPVSSTLAMRVDGGYHKRDGYMRDVNSDRMFNNLNRYFVRGQALYENEGLSVRLIGDFSKTDEQCCIPIHANPGTTGPAVDFIAGLAGLDGILFPNDARDRRVAISPNRNPAEKVRDWGVSAEIGYDFGDFSLTSITAYRDWRALRNQDIDFSGMDRTYREGYRSGMRDFTQEVRFQGKLFDGVLDFMVGGFYLDEKLMLRDTIRLGTQASLYSDVVLGSLTTGLSPLAPNGFSLFGSLPGQPFVGNALLADPSVRALVAANPSLLRQFTTYLPSINSSGQIADNYRVHTQAIGLFTHNIVNLSDRLSLTFGLRFNHEKKDLDADLNAANPGCSAILPGGSSSVFGQALAASPLSSIALLVCNPAINPEFNGVYSDGRSESELTGTARAAWRLTPAMMAFAGYSRGYKSGGYNLDRSGFDSVYFGGNGAQISDLTFAKETADSYEVGIKTNFSRAFQLNVTGFYQDFANFQSLRFEGSAFVVRQFDEVISKGVELESVVRPIDQLTVNLAYTYLHTVVNDPINAAEDDGKQATNQPRHVLTASLTWTPPLTDDISGLFHVNARMNGDSNTINAAEGVRFTTNDGYVIVNARVGVNFDGGRFGVEAYVENLFDSYYNIAAFPVPEQVKAYAVYPPVPRLYGVRLKARF